MKLWYCEFGYCGLFEGNKSDAYRDACDDIGKNNIRVFREATLEDINHIKAMGGWVPEKYR